jgi:hypothetical protein
MPTTMKGTHRLCGQLHNRRVLIYNASIRQTMNCRPHFLKLRRLATPAGACSSNYARLTDRVIAISDDWSDFSGARRRSDHLRVIRWKSIATPFRIFLGQRRHFARGIASTMTTDDVLPAFSSLGADSAGIGSLFDRLPEPALWQPNLAGEGTSRVPSDDHHSSGTTRRHRHRTSPLPQRSALSAAADVTVVPRPQVLGSRSNSNYGSGKTHRGLLKDRLKVASICQPPDVPDQTGSAGARHAHALTGQPLATGWATGAAGGLRTHAGPALAAKIENVY